MRRLPFYAWLLAALATALIALVTGELYRVPAYKAGLAAVSKEPNSVTVLFYDKRFDLYQAQGLLTMPATGWKVTRTEDFVRLDNLRDAPPLRLSPREEPLRFSLLRHPWGGVAALDGEIVGNRKVNLNAPQESIEHFEIGPKSAGESRAGLFRFAGPYSIALIAGTFLLLMGVAWYEWPRYAALPEAAARLSWADLARSVAIFGVVVIHACGPMFYEYGRIPPDSWQQVVFLDALARCSVPLFVMLSGALLVRPGAPAPGLRVVAGRVRKLLLPLLAWSVAYLLYKDYTANVPVDWTTPLRQPAMYHLWFVYMIIGLYLMLPVLQGIANTIAARRDLQAYLLALWLVLTVTPLYAPVPLLEMLQQTSLFGYGGYFLLGAFLASRPAPGPSWAWALAFALAVLATFALTSAASQAAGEAVEKAFQYFSANVVAASVSAFVLLTRVRPGPRLAALSQWVADRSFLVFFVHVVVLERTASALQAMDTGLPTVIAVLGVSVVTFLLCLVCASALRVIPRAREVTG